MDLLENEEQLQKKKKAKIIMIIIAVFIVILLVVSGVLAVQIGNIQNSKLKLVVDRQSKEIPANMFVIENNKLYINIKKFAEMVGYHTYNGDFKTKYSEDTTNCYISSGTDLTTSDEVASYALNSASMYKQVQNLNNSSVKEDVTYDYEYFDLDEPVTLKSGELFTTIEGMEIGTNCMINHDTSNNTITVNTLDNIATTYASAFPNSAVAVDGDKVLFNNKKALKEGLVVVESADKHYGVVDSEGEEIIGTKYASVEYKEGSREFTVRTDEGKMGILSADGKTKIEPNYTEIKQISKDLNYYLVKNDTKYGVINQNGNPVIYLEYDQIGIDEDDFISNDIENPYILYDYCIPVMQSGKWGVFNIDGQIVIPLDYTTIGCINKTNKDFASNNVVIIPQYEAIVMGTADEKYAILSAQGDVYVPAVLDSVYSVTTSGEDDYFMTFTLQQEQDGKMVDVSERYNVEEYFTEQNIIPEPVQPQLNTNTNTTTGQTNQNGQAGQQGGVQQQTTTDPNAGQTQQQQSTQQQQPQQQPQQQVQQQPQQQQVQQQQQPQAQAQQPAA